MRFASFPKINKRVWRPALFALTLAWLSFVSGLTAWARSRPSFVYCLNHDGAKVFAGREEVDGSLKFGISVWSPSGQNISVFGLATRRGRDWRYTDNLQAGTAAERCQLDIVSGPDCRLRVMADRNATCQSRGGVNAEIGTVQFPHTAYEGAVTTELDDPEAFQKAGKCVDGKN